MWDWERIVACSLELPQRQSWGQRDWNGDEGGTGRVRTKLAVLTGQCSRRFWTEAPGLPECWECGGWGMCQQEPIG